MITNIEEIQKRMKSRAKELSEIYNVSEVVLYCAMVDGFCFGIARGFEILFGNNRKM